MKNISSLTLQYLEKLNTEYQNGVKLITALKDYLDGTNKLVINSRNVDEFQDILETGKFKSSSGKQFELPGPLKNILHYDPNDDFLTYTLNSCVNTFVTSQNDKSAELGELTQKQYIQAHANETGSSLSNAAEIRSHFWINYFFNYQNYYKQNSDGTFSAKFRNSASPAEIAFVVRNAIVTRLNNWIKVKSGPNPVSDEQVLIGLEKIFISEEYGIAAQALNSTIEEDSTLRRFIDKGVNKSNNTPVDVTPVFDDLLKKAFVGIDFQNIDSTSKKYFLSVFRGSDVERAAQLSERTFDALINRLESSGLLKLASHASSIEQFARSRFSSVEQLKRSAKDSINPVRDTAWLSELNYAIQNISRDPITLSVLNIYFPSLVTFFFDSIAIASDYSNNGKGGGSEDSINNLNDFMDSLEKAFGRTVDFNRK